LRGEIKADQFWSPAINIYMDENIFKNHQDYWMVADNIRDLYLSEGSLLTLLDFERVLDELDIYAFRNWDRGELVQGPDIGKYKVGCIFMWPENLMPDPRGGRRLLPFDCEVKFKKVDMKIPIKVTEPSDYEAGTHIARLITKKVWLVEIIMPKNLIADIRTGSIDLEGEEIDLQDLDDAYAQDLDKDQYQNEEKANAAQQQLQQPSAAPGGLGAAPPAA
jgi:hypothetical protein